MMNSKIKKNLSKEKMANLLLDKKRANIKILGDIIKPVLNEKNWNACNKILVNKI